MKVAILGAGVSGLTIAYRLCQEGISVCLLDTAPRLGGVIQSFHWDGFLAEAGPHSLRFNQRSIQQLLQDLGLESEMIATDPMARKRFLVHRGRLLALPQSLPGAVTTPLLSLQAKLRVLCEPFVSRSDAQSDESLAAFISRRLGSEVLETMVDPWVAGIYAGDPQRLSVRYALPRLWDLEQQHGSLLRGAWASARARRYDSELIKPRMMSFKNGMQTLTDTLAQALPEGAVASGISLDRIVRSSPETGWRVAWTHRGQATEAAFDRLVLALPAHRLGSLPFAAETKAASCLLDDPQWQTLSRIPYAPVAILTLGFRQEQLGHPLDGFGFLVPARERRRILGVIFSSSVFPNRAPSGYVTLSVFLGGARHPRDVERSETELKALALAELSSLLGVSGEPVYMRLMPWHQAIPQYECAYGAYLQAMDDLEAHWPGLSLAGNYRCGVSLAQCLEDGLQQAEKIILG